MVDELRAIGGGARSNAWLQLKADVTDPRCVRHWPTRPVGVRRFSQDMVLVASGLSSRLLVMRHTSCAGMNPIVSDSAGIRSDSCCIANSIPR